MVHYNQNKADNDDASGELIMRLQLDMDINKLNQFWMQ